MEESVKELLASICGLPGMMANTLESTVIADLQIEQSVVQPKANEEGELAGSLNGMFLGISTEASNGPQGTIESEKAQGFHLADLQLLAMSCSSTTIFASGMAHDFSCFTLTCINLFEQVVDTMTFPFGLNFLESQGNCPN